tara:strand:+ start:253 stop:606 length:354 start_codon:yes stop_codon:yes gene_type:complete
MAHFAKIGMGNKVTDVIVVSNDIATSEQAGIDFLKNLFNDPSGTYIQTSYNDTIRGKFAAISGLYDQDNDRFLPTQPYASWIFNEELYRYTPPTPYPDESKNYRWNEQTQAWDLVDD